MPTGLKILSSDKPTYFYPLDAYLSPEQLRAYPACLKILLENNIRNQHRSAIPAGLLNWIPKHPVSHSEINFYPARILLQDFTGVPALVDLAAMRDAFQANAGDPDILNPEIPVDCVIDHSVVVNFYGDKTALAKNIELEFENNHERYAFLCWCQKAFKNLRIVPPGTGICHQVNLEYLAQGVFEAALESEAGILAYPDTLVGTDSHTPMINSLGVLGWGVGGIEAEAAMLGQPINLLLPTVVGVELTGQLPNGSTGTDLVLTLVQILRAHGVVGKFVEFYGSGLDRLPIADRATISNMAPEYGATCGLFPIDQETLNYFKFTGRSPEKIKLLEHYAKTQCLFRDKHWAPQFDEYLSLDLKTVQPCIAGPKQPQSKILLSESKQKIQALKKQVTDSLTLQNSNPDKHNPEHPLDHFDVVIAAITSCTNTSNPEVMLSAGLVAQKAVQYGLKSKPWIKTSLAPGSQVVTEYLKQANLLEPLQKLGFDIVGYGCTTCIGNSGPLPEPVSQAIEDRKLSVAAVLSGNRNFEGRIQSQVQNSFLASPPLVVAYALAGTMEIDFETDPLGIDPKSKQSIYLRDLWPSHSEIQQAIAQSVKPEQFQQKYASVFTGDQKWQTLISNFKTQYDWDPNSTYIQKPPFFKNFSRQVKLLKPIQSARVLVKLGDSITTDHISPAGSIPLKSTAGQYLNAQNIPVDRFNAYGTRRGNHEVMVRGTLANIRIRNQLTPSKEGSWTIYFPTQETLPIYDAAIKYQHDHTDLIILAGKAYGSGSSRDWAAKGVRLLGVRAVIAESYERIHRSNLIGMGILPLEFLPGETCETLKLTGHESFSIPTLDLETITPNGLLQIIAEKTEPSEFKQVQFTAKIRIDTPQEQAYYLNDGILNFVLRHKLNA